MGDRSKRAVPSSPVASDSPSTPRAKRVSSLPPSHHLPTAENNRRGLRVRNKLLTAHAGCVSRPRVPSVTERDAMNVSSL